MPLDSNYDNISLLYKGSKINKIKDGSVMKGVVNYDTLSQYGYGFLDSISLYHLIINVYISFTLKKNYYVH